MSGPLAGVRVVDLSTVLMGPHATQALADMGAEVIKVEAPEGDVIRQIGPARHPGMGALFLNANRGKRSLCLDLKDARGREALLAVLRDADVLVHNLRPQAMARLALDYARLAPKHPHLVYATLCGFGSGGPYSGRPAYDDLIQGAAGLPYWIAKAGDGTPRYVPTALADRVVGTAAVGAICAALFHRERSGVGQEVEVPMFETMAAMVLADHLSGATFEPPLPGEGYARLLSRERRPYRTRDGHVCAMVYTDRQWSALLAELGEADLPQRDPRFAGFAARSTHIDAVYAWLAARFLERDTAEWLALLERIDVPVMPMHDVNGLLADPHLAAVGFFGELAHPSEGRLRQIAPPWRWSACTPGPLRPAPRQGEHGVAVLREAGLDAAAIDALVDAGVLQLPPASTETG
ncbi:CaiB/BaiF CoA transferase family protein [Luteimonas sp. SDU101]|uniref:CaiB/BaiF CoA transferase family protein n=1 Tax=Luteimonas sp. SDU101 TaxID=3422593 RepID=UPI003EBB0A2A